ncbi:kinase-like domain-containing protein [Dissophora ornata]|nr:kinase-like domain-containing protein [Dissophora ornata]
MTTLSQQAANIAGLATEELVNHAESSGSADLQHSQQVQSFGRLSQGDPDQSSQRIRGGSVASDPYYPAYLAENDEEDADRWTFASSLSFDQREKKGSIPSLRYIPARTPSAAGAPRAMTQSAANLTHNYAASRAPRRDGSAPSILSGKGSSVGAGSASLSPTAAGGHALGREGSIGQRDTALFNSLSPLDRVSLMCSGIDTESQASGDDDGISATHLHPRSPQWRDSYYRRSFVSTTVDEEEERYRALNRMGSTSTTNSSTVYTTLDHPALVMLIQNLPARYLVSKSPSPIHGASNDILFAVDSDTQQPIVIKSFTRREAWERECRTLKRLRGPCIVELKHMATLVLSETDDPNKPAKIRLTILERLDETLAQMLKNARKTKKLALREQAASTSIDSTEEGAKLDLSGAELYRTGPALDACYIKDIVKGVLRCLTWCHSKKIVYCALKPTNIMRNRDDPRQQWKLIDLESSRVAEEERTSVGTTRYCPPEIALAAANSSTTGVTAQYSMDLWAFGCLLYELFATRPLIPLSAPDEMVIHFLAHPSPDTPALPNGLRWASPHELEIPHFEQAVQDKNARQLISILLHPDPQHRAVLDQVLNSEYLNGTLSA